MNDDEENYSDLSAIELKAHKEEFYQILKSYGFDFDDIDEKTRLPKSMIPVIANKFDAVMKFNYALEMMHRKKQVPIIESFVYLVTDFFEPKQLLKIIQTNNLNFLQMELKKKYKLDDKIDILSKINMFIM